MAQPPSGAHDLQYNAPDSVGRLGLRPPSGVVEKPHGRLQLSELSARSYHDVVSELPATGMRSELSSARASLRSPLGERSSSRRVL